MNPMDFSNGNLQQRKFLDSHWSHLALIINGAVIDTISLVKLVFQYGQYKTSGQGSGLGCGWCLTIGSKHQLPTCTCLFYKIGGMPLQTTTDCRSKTTEVYGFASALRYSEKLVKKSTTIWIHTIMISFNGYDQH
ncbi:uncharacterized protein EDB93DRAFT_1106948 [Suillus bovinus]|uniref:uncharacterized protein n=1 Tax=Suillus bovinus TaxID=48563 RepID=UPI001B886FFF|nr:uncharacterized protein EDB93DRAFT_1106948 [Suillus bovinus]KAG2136076.1 hypothetical protein EDB93DRAFT_1106948 [Suillus bovinus]